MEEFLPREFNEKLHDIIAKANDTITTISSGSVPQQSSGGHGMVWLWILALVAVVFLVWRLWKRNPGFLAKLKTKNMLESSIKKEKKEILVEDDSSAFSETKNIEKEKSPDVVEAFPCIAAVCSDTRKSKNQDSCCAAYVEKAQARIIAVADGVGSSYKAEQGSKVVAAKAVELIREAIVADEYHIDFSGIFDQVQEELDKMVETSFAADLEGLKPGSFATTLIVGIDFPDRFVAAYVGNGSIWHFSGLFNSFPPVMCLPWNAVNLLNPDTSMKEGREALYKIFYYKGEKKHHKPTVLQVSKLREDPGDMFIITTDGVYSADHAIAGKDDEGEIWVPSTAQFGLLCDHLKQYVDGTEDINDATLEAVIKRYLDHIKEAKIMDDDTTLGVFISQEAKKHFLENRKVNETN